MDTSRRETQPWSGDELRAILEHQLATPIAVELEHSETSLDRSIEEALTSLRSSGCHTFQDLLSADSPPIWALRTLKEFARESRVGEGALPREVARVLHVVAILRARQASVTDFTSLDDANVDREAWRCLMFPWLPDAIRRSLKKGVLGF